MTTISYIHVSIRYADHVTIGDKVLIQENTEMVPATIINISTIKIQGNISSKRLSHRIFGFAFLHYFLANLIIFDISDAMYCQP